MGKKKTIFGQKCQFWAKFGPFGPRRSRDTQTAGSRKRRRTSRRTSRRPTPGRRAGKGSWAVDNFLKNQLTLFGNSVCVPNFHFLGPDLPI